GPRSRRRAAARDPVGVPEGATRPAAGPRVDPRGARRLARRAHPRPRRTGKRGMRIGVDLDDVVAECAVPYLRAFAERYRLELPDEDLGWQTLAKIENVSGEEKDRFRIALYDGKFFSELEPYEDCPAVVESLAGAGHELYFITARAERRRVVTETWLREQGLIQHA